MSSPGKCLVTPCVRVHQLFQNRTVNPLRQVESYQNKYCKTIIYCVKMCINSLKCVSLLPIAYLLKKIQILLEGNPIRRFPSGAISCARAEPVCPYGREPILLLNHIILHDRQSAFRSQIFCILDSWVFPLVQTVVSWF